MKLDPNSVGYLLLSNWGPPIVTIFVGGAFASLLVPRWQARWNRDRATEERRIALYEAISEHFSMYVTAWRRLLQIARLERERNLSELERARKEDYLRSRTDARDSLICEFAKARIYFSRNSGDAIAKFVHWDEKNGSKNFGDLPDIEEWREWEDLIVENLRQDLYLR